MTNTRKSISKKLKAEIKAKTNHRCGYCGTSIKDRCHIDHIHPVCRGHQAKFEVNATFNLLTSCASCNMFKSSFTLEEFKNPAYS